MLVEIKFNIELPDVRATDKELEDYIKYMIGIRNIIPKNSPYTKYHEKTMSQKTTYEYREITE